MFTVAANLIFDEGSLPGLQTDAFSLYLHVFSVQKHRKRYLSHLFLIFIRTAIPSN